MITLGCTGLPANSTCTFAPPTLTSIGTGVAQTTILTLQTAASNTAELQRASKNIESRLALTF